MCDFQYTGKTKEGKTFNEMSPDLNDLWPYILILLLEADHLQWIQQTPIFLDPELSNTMDTEK